MRTRNEPTIASWVLWSLPSNKRINRLYGPQEFLIVVYFYNTRTMRKLTKLVRCSWGKAIELERVIWGCQLQYFSFYAYEGCRFCLDLFTNYAIEKSSTLLLLYLAARPCTDLSRVQLSGVILQSCTPRRGIERYQLTRPFRKQKLRWFCLKY